MGPGGWEIGGDPDAPDRQGRGHHRHVAARPGSRDGVEPDRGRPARCALRGRRGPPRRHRRSPTRGSTPMARAALVVGGEAVVRAADKVIEKAKAVCGAPARGQASDDLEFAGGPVCRQGHRPRRSASPRWLWRPSLRTTTRTTSSPGIDADATYDPVDFSFPHGTHLCAMEVDTETGESTDAQVRLRRRHRP
jgi:hypothetical protein